MFFTIRPNEVLLYINQSKKAATTNCELWSCFSDMSCKRQYDGSDFLTDKKGALFSLNAACKYILYTCSNCVIVTKLLRDTFLLLQYFLLFIFFSRAHTIVAITFTQKQMNETGQSMTRTSTVNLVDLAGRYVHKSRSIQ